MSKDGFVLKQVKRYNLRLLIATLILICFTASAAGSFPKYWHNLKNGPFTIDANKLKAIGDADAENEYYIKVKGEEVYDIIKEEGYLLLDMKEGLLIIKGAGEENSLEFAGELKNLSGADREQIYNALQQKVDLEKIKPAIYPVMVEAGDIKSSGTYKYLIFALLLIIILRNLVEFMRRNSNPALHPICKFLSKFGETDVMVRTVDSEVERAGGLPKKSSVIVTESWLIAKRLFKLEFIALSDIVWIYQKVTSHSYNFIPTGKTYELIVYTQDKEKHEIKAKNSKSGGEILENVNIHAPWAFAGYSENIEQLWKKNSSEFIKRVQDRFKQVREYGEESLKQG